MEKKQKEFSENFVGKTPEMLKKEDEKLLSDYENVFGEYLEKLQKTNMLRSEYILELCSLAEKYKDNSKSEDYEKVFFSY